MKQNTILWADDDNDDLQMMQEVLAKHERKFEIVEVSNGLEALRYMEQQGETELPCLVILDINMPVLDGKETLSMMKRSEKLREVPVVIFTTSASELDRLYCKKFNTEMITKPPNFESFEQAVVKILDSCNL